MLLVSKLWFYRVIQKERSIFWELISSATVRIKFTQTGVQLWIFTEIELFESPELTPFHFCLWGWKKIEICKRKANARDELLDRILNAAARINKRDYQLRRTTWDFRRRVAKYILDNSGICQQSLWIVTKFSFLSNQFLCLHIKLN